MRFTTQEFEQGFHSLKGVSIGERRKSLFHLLNNIRRHDHAAVDFTAPQPKTHLEAILKLETLIFFQQTGDVFEVLKSENPFLIGKVLKTKAWFWNAAFKNITGQQFVDDVLGRISYNTKVQLLNKLSIYLSDNVKGNEYYESVKSKYGTYLAAKLIPCCTKEFILTAITQDHIKLLESKLLLIVKKHPDIVDDILSALAGIGVAVSHEYDNVFKYIANKNMDQYFKLQKKYRIKLRFGWRSTQKFLDEHKGSLVDNAYELYNLFHSKQVVRSLKTSFIPFFINMFPKTIDECNRYDMESLLKIVKHLRVPDANIVLDCFKKVYGRDLWDTPDLVSIDLLEMMTPAERETKLLQKYKPPFLSDDKWVCFKPTKVSIPYLKDRIAVSSDVDARCDLITLLVETCKLNRDKVALAQVCQFIVNRHRNDKVGVRLGFLRNVQSSFELEDLDESHWTPINELIKIFTLNREPFYNATDFLQSYILYRLKRNLPIKEQLTELCESKCKSWNLFKKYPEFEKVCLLEFANIIPVVYKDEELDANYLKFLLAVISYNQRHKHDTMSIFSYPYAIESLKRGFQETSGAYHSSAVISYCARLKDNATECSRLLQYALSTIENCKYEILLHLIYKDPGTVQKHITQVTNLILKCYSSKSVVSFWLCSKNYEHLEIPQNIIKVCLNAVKQDIENGRGSEQHAAIHGLACLMPSHEYLQIVALHYPRELRADAETQKGQKTYELQQYIALSLKHINPPSEALESILNFCKGDYLKLIQSSLYSVCCNTNEDKLQPFFAELIGRAVSIRKHALHLTFHILDKAEIFTVLDKFMKNEKNPSIRKFIFKHTFNLFVKSRDDYSWELVKLNIDSVDVNDQEAFDILLQYRKIPKNYLDKYVEFTWDFLERRDPDRKLEPKKVSLLNSISNDVVPLLSKQFCENTINKYLFETEKHTPLQDAIQTFTCKYTIYNNPTFINSIFDRVKNHVNMVWQMKELAAGGRYFIKTLVEKFCDEYLNDDGALPFTKVLVNFLQIWNDNLKPHQAFPEYLHLTLTALYLRKLTIKGTVKELATLCNLLVDAYGIAIMSFVSDKIDFFIHNFVGFQDKENVFVFINELVEHYPSLCCALLAIRLLDRNKPTSKTQDQYDKIIQLLQTRNDPIIHIYLHVHITESAD